MDTRIVTTFCIGWLVLAMLSAEESPVQLDKISIHLFLENTGTFTDDITSVLGFGTWNFRPFGIGFSEDDIFHSFLIKVWLSSERETFQAGEQARVLVRSEKTGKVLFDSTINGVYIGREGRTVMPLLVAGHVCEPLIVEVRGRPKSITKMLPFACGESKTI
jgi:hypothetical protein